MKRSVIFYPVAMGFLLLLSSTVCPQNVNNSLMMADSFINAEHRVQKETILMILSGEVLINHMTGASKTFLRVTNSPLTRML